MTKQQVAQLRDPATAGANTTLLTLARAGMAVGVVVLLALVGWLLARRRKG